MQKKLKDMSREIVLLFEIIAIVIIVVFGLAKILKTELKNYPMIKYSVSQQRQTAVYIKGDWLSCSEIDCSQFNKYEKIYVR